MERKSIKGDFYFIIIDKDYYPNFDENMISELKEKKLIEFDRFKNLALEDIGFYSDDNFVINNNDYDNYRGVLIGYYESPNVTMTIVLQHMEIREYFEGDYYNIKKIVENE